MPGWLRAFVDVNPVSLMTTALRGLMGGGATAAQVAAGADRAGRAHRHPGADDAVALSQTVMDERLHRPTFVTLTRPTRPIHPKSPRTDGSASTRDFHDRTHSGFRHARHSCGRAARPGDRRARDADLPDHILRVRRRRSCRRAVRAADLRQYLHAHQQPDQGGAGGARRRARRRHRGARGRFRPRRAGHRDPYADASRATNSSPPASSMAARSTSSITRSRISAGTSSGPTRTTSRSFERAVTPEDQGDLHRVDRQSGRRRHRHRGDRRHRQAGRRAADRRQHAGDALSVQADRATAPTSSSIR